MKNQEDIERRLHKLRRRYAHKYVQASQERKPCNCTYNFEDKGDRTERATNLSLGPKIPLEEEWAPRIQRTLMVIQDTKPVRFCMYGSDKPETWNGVICDTDETARQCPYFTPATDMKVAREEFLEKLSDDEYVFNNFRDVATLQWVLGKRVHEDGLSWWERLTFWLKEKFTRVVKPTPQLPPSEVSSDLWDD